MVGMELRTPQLLPPFIIFSGVPECAKGFDQDTSVFPRSGSPV